MAGYAEKYANLMSTASVKKRGIALYETDSVKSGNYNKSSQIWTFKVQGSRLYTVQIHDTGNKILSASCTCPYDWHGICKHTVAALLYIENKDRKSISNKTQTKQKKNSKKISKRNGWLPFKIEKYKIITAKFIEEHYDTFNEILYSIFGTHLLNVQFKKSSINFSIRFYENVHEVKIFKKNDNVYIKSDEITNVPANKLTKSEALVLYLISESASPDMLQLHFGEQRTEFEKKALKRYGLPEDADYYDYFSYDFDQQQGYFSTLTEKSSGLIPIESGQENYFSTLLKEIENTSASIELPKFKRKETRQLGFVVDIITEYELKFRIIPIIGKTDKNRTKFTAKLEEFSKEAEQKYDIDFTENQKKILKIFEEQFNNETDYFKLYYKIFKLLVNEPFVYGRIDEPKIFKKKDLFPVKVSDTDAQVKVFIHESDAFLHASIKLFVNDQVIPVNKENRSYLKMGFILTNGVLYPLGNSHAASFFDVDMHEFKMVKDYKEVFYERIVAPLSKNFDLIIQDNLFEYKEVELDFTKKQIFLSEEDDFIVIKPQVVYGNNQAVILAHNGNLHEKEGDKITVLKRNFELEDEFIQQIAELHPDFEKQSDDKIFWLHHEDFIKNMWFFKFFERMQQIDVEIYGLKNLKKFRYSPYKGKINTSVSSGQDWFDVNIELSFGEQTVSLQDIRKAIINKQNYILLKDGSVGILPKEWLKKLEKYFRNGEIKSGKLKISKLRFSIIDELFEKIDDTKILQELQNKRKLLQQFKEIEKVKVPKSIKANLRDYQKEGLNWLNFLDKMKWGGILADDMGLGKTLQILSFLQHKASKNKSANLIVVPTTLLFNWQNEIEKFAPKLNAYYHYGTDRVKDSKIFDDYDIVFTTYGILLRDIELLKSYKFNYMILDESQAIKNPASRRYKAAVLIEANNKLALTGTPIENSTFDLFAQMNFVNPGLFGSLSSFKNNYSNPIDKYGDEEVAQELQKIINPFVLRRTKEQVAKELPPKIEDYIYCEMEPEQRKVYEAYRNNYREKLLNQIEEKGIGKSKFMVLEALTRLRQICDSPALLKDNEVGVNQSVKIKEIIHHITEKTANHKILIFSQFVEMLSLLKEELIKRSIDFEYLDGQSSSTQREISVNNFQNNDNLRVFLISLKAGGTGLNLTAADYVYILDPWWNPAVENQAIDRCYRIGQDKHVFAYRMICKDTIEEKIMNLQAKKRKIATDIIQTDENIMKTIDINDIKAFFS